MSIAIMELAKRVEVIEAQLAILISEDTPADKRQREIAYGPVRADCERPFASSSGWRCECHKRMGGDNMLISNWCMAKKQQIPGVG